MEISSRAKSTFFISALIFVCSVIQAQQKYDAQIRETFYFNNIEREYFIKYPSNYNPDKKYWLIVVVHGGGGNGSNYFLTDGISHELEDKDMDAILVTPSFSNLDVQASRFPELGEGEFLKQILIQLQNKINLHKKIFLTGYSRGGQFSHRFALGNPDLVKACAPFAAGTWTTPDGTLLVESIGEITNPESFLSDKSNASKVPERLKGMFDIRVAEVAGKKANINAKVVPFLVMCGTLDPRYTIGKQFSNSLKKQGYNVQTDWPENPHGKKSEYPDEFKKYSKNATEFFLKVMKED